MKTGIFIPVYCKTIIVSVPLNIAFLAFWLLALNIAYILKILVCDDVILFIEHVVSFCACAMDITKYFKRAIFSILTSLIFKAAKYRFVFWSLNVVPLTIRVLSILWVKLTVYYGLNLQYIMG